MPGSTSGGAQPASSLSALPPTTTAWGGPSKQEVLDLVGLFNIGEHKLQISLVDSDFGRLDDLLQTLLSSTRISWEEAQKVLDIVWAEFQFKTVLLHSPPSTGTMTCGRHNLCGFWGLLQCSRAAVEADMGKLKSLCKESREGWRVLEKFLEGMTSRIPSGEFRDHLLGAVRYTREFARGRAGRMEPDGCALHVFYTASAVNLGFKATLFLGLGADAIEMVSSNAYGSNLWDGGGDSEFRVIDVAYPLWGELARALAVPAVKWAAQHYSLLWTGKDTIVWDDHEREFKRKLLALYMSGLTPPTPSSQPLAPPILVNDVGAHIDRIRAASTPADEHSHYLLVGNVTLSVGERADELLLDICQGLDLLLAHATPRVTLEGVREGLARKLLFIGQTGGSILIALDGSVDTGFGHGNFATQEVASALWRGRTVYTFLLMGLEEAKTVVNGSAVGAVRGAVRQGMHGEIVRRVCHRNLRDILGCAVTLIPTILRSGTRSELIFEVAAVGTDFAKPSPGAIKALQRRMGVTPGGTPVQLGINGVFVEYFGQLSDCFGRPLFTGSLGSPMGHFSSQVLSLKNAPSTISLSDLLGLLTFAAEDGIVVAMVDWVLLVLDPARWVIALTTDAPPLSAEAYQVGIGSGIGVGDVGMVASRIRMQPSWSHNDFPSTANSHPKLGPNPNTPLYTIAGGVKATAGGGTKEGGQGAAVSPTRKSNPQQHGKARTPDRQLTSRRVGSPGSQVQQGRGSYRQAAGRGAKETAVGLRSPANDNLLLMRTLDAVEGLTTRLDASQGIQDQTLRLVDVVMDRLQKIDERQAAEALKNADRDVILRRMQSFALPPATQPNP